MHRIYLDNAATSWPKPESVYAAIDHFMRQNGTPAGRSGYREAMETERIVSGLRMRLAQMLGADELSRVVFTLNGTDALNQAIHGVLRSGDHVVTTQAEHNSVLRPLRHLAESAGVIVTRVPCDPTGCVDADEIAAALRPETQLVAVTHASNVTGSLQPVQKLGPIVRRHGALLLVDAAQTIGHMPVRVEDLQADLLAAPGHKALLGPLGTGILYVGPRAQERLDSTRQGGTGTHSEDDHQPEELPEKYEAGNLNVPGIVGLAAGLQYIADRGLDAIRQHETDLLQRLLAGLRSIAGVTIYGPADAEQRIGLVSITVAGHDSQEVAAALDAGYRIQTRSGLHCAPLMHRALGTDQLGGTVRFSLGPFNEVEHIDAAVDAITDIATASTTM